jgi:hypothetical protein
MSDNAKSTSDHFRLCALVYVRQCTAAQVEKQNRESTERPYKLVDRTVALGWKRDNVNVVAQDLGVSGAGLADRSSFASITAQVVLGQISIVLIQGHHVQSVRFHPDEAAKTTRTVLDRLSMVMIIEGRTVKLNEGDLDRTVPGFRFRSPPYGREPGTGNHVESNCPHVAMH